MSQHIYFLGIGGTLMGSLAQLAREMGCRVTGSDKPLYPPMSDQLSAAGIPTVIAMSAVFRGRTLAMNPARVVLTRHIMGRPMGAPGNSARQRQVTIEALKLLETATGPCSIVELKEPYRFS